MKRFLLWLLRAEYDPWTGEELWLIRRDRELGIERASDPVMVAAWDKAMLAAFERDDRFSAVALRDAAIEALGRRR